MIVALWSRLYVHYAFQYAYLKWIKVPVTSITMKWYRIDIVYDYWNPF